MPQHSLQHRAATYPDCGVGWDISPLARDTVKQNVLALAPRARPAGRETRPTRSCDPQSACQRRLGFAGATTNPPPAVPAIIGGDVDGRRPAAFSRLGSFATPAPDCGDDCAPATRNTADFAARALKGARSRAA